MPKKGDIGIHEVKRPATQAGGKNGDGGEEHESLVRDRVISQAEAIEDEEGEEDQTAEVGGKNKAGFVRRKGVTTQRSEEDEGAKDQHECGDDAAEDAELAMPADAAYRDKNRLSEEKEEPEGEEGSVNVDQGAGQRGADEAGQEVGVGEANDIGREEEQHDREEKDVFTALVRGAKGHWG